MLKYFAIPFANAGGKTAVPATDPGTGAVSYATGWGPYYQLAKTDPNSLNVDRQQTNQTLFDITSEIKLLQEHGTPDFITAALNSGVAYSYGIGDRVRYDAGDGFRTYVSRVAANVDLPSVAASWTQERNGVPVAVAGGTSNALTANFAPDFLAIQNGDIFLLEHTAAANPGGAVTLALDGGTAYPVVKRNDIALDPADIAGPNSWGLYSWDASLSKFVLLNPASALGVGQIYQNVVRNTGIDYYNLTGRPKFLVYSYRMFNLQLLVLSVDAASSVATISNDDAAQSIIVTMCAVIPPGSRYSLSGSFNSIISQVELG